MDKNLKTILIIDDTDVNINLLMEILEDKYDLLASLDGEGGLDILNEEDVDLVLLDIMMPDMDGFEVCRRIKENESTKDIPVIFITAVSDEKSIEKAYDIGGVDYIRKPFMAKEVISRINTHISLSDQKHLLQNEVKTKTLELHSLNKEIEETQKEVVFTMGAIGETRSKETGNHVKRVAEYSKVLAKYSGMSDEEVALLVDASPMHDIGKVAIHDNILHKPGKLTNEEFILMREHSEIGYKMLSHSKRPLLKTAAKIALEHHERWDGDGYPKHLKEEEISIEGRITAIADVFDALGSDRCYKQAWEDEKIFNYFKEQKGKQFNPKLVDIFFEHLDEFLDIRERFRDI
jgi:putative two-component system response regulator